MANVQRIAAAAVYSFADTQVTITYNGVTSTIEGNKDVGGIGFSDEGITITRPREKNIMTEGADGAIMHSLRAGRTARITFSLLKTSAGNAIFSTLYNTQEQQSSTWGRNTIVINNTSTGDNVVGQVAAFVREPDNHYRTEGGVNEWAFDVGFLDQHLGNGFQPTGVIQ